MYACVCVQEAEKVCNWSWPFVALIAVRGKLKQNFVKAAIRIAVIELCIYHGLRNLLLVLCDTLSQCFISGASVYILRCLHLYSFESYDRLFAL